MSVHGVIFNLDGVLVTTNEYHFRGPENSRPGI